ncbi:hypothetical protein FFLO_03268 [Filobasidium floriforme]|uniref:Glycosyltransferase family 34 protein n=1 Tax=Filobasidium floriforme TaxID=5210 RepID=A0A8K0JKZ4_9TREE
MGILSTSLPVSRYDVIPTPHDYHHRRPAHTRRYSTRRILFRLKVLLGLVLYSLTVFYLEEISNLVLPTFTLPHHKTWFFPRYTPRAVIPATASQLEEGMPRVLIVQYEPPTLGPWSRLYRASVRNHEDYAKAWGYGYKVDSFPYVREQGWGRARIWGKVESKGYMNKVYALERALLEELAKEKDERAEWIWVVDVDTFIVDPSIPLTDYLPPPSLYSSGNYDSENHDGKPTPLPLPPLILGNQDHNGLNYGVMIYHVERLALDFVHTILQLEQEHILTEKKAPTDQHLVCDILKSESDPRFGERFWEIPQRWLNGYTLPEVGSGGRKDGRGYDHNDPDEVDDLDSHEGEDILDSQGPGPAMHVHLVNAVKEKLPYTDLLRACDEVYLEAELKANSTGVEGNGLRLLSGERRRAKKAARRWWSTHGPGVEGMKFNEY